MKTRDIQYCKCTMGKMFFMILSKKVTNTKFEILNEAEHDYLFFRKRIPEIVSFLFSESKNVAQEKNI